MIYERANKQTNGKEKATPGRTALRPASAQAGREQPIRHYCHGNCKEFCRDNGEWGIHISVSCCNKTKSRCFPKNSRKSNRTCFHLPRSRRIYLKIYGLFVSENLVFSFPKVFTKLWRITCKSFCQLNLDQKCIQRRPARLPKNLKKWPINPFPPAYYQYWQDSAYLLHWYTRCIMENDHTFFSFRSAV